MRNLKIFVSSVFLPEKQYIINTLFGQFLGVPFSIVPTNNSNPFFRIELPNKSEIIISDSFFSGFTEHKGYLIKEAIPDRAKYLHSDFSPENDLPFLFGNDVFKLEENGKGNTILCGADIIASAFFFLTRWEEHVLPQRDKHGRFPCKYSFIQRNNLESRALVNEYVEFLWNILQKLSYTGIRKSRKYKVVPTHDVDNFMRFDTYLKSAKTLLSDLIIRRNTGLFLKDLKLILKIRSDKQKDPFDTFDYLMDESEKIACVSEFYFIPAIKGEYDFQYSINDDRLAKTIKNIAKRGHKIGMHASYNVLKKPMVFLAELKRLKNIYPEIRSNRNHFLRFEVPASWQVMADNNFTKSSNMAFSNKAGFRSSCCYPYQVFNILSRKVLDLIEQPLIMMEAALVKDKVNPDDFFLQAIELANEVKKYNGEYVFLWHNSNFNLPEWEAFAKGYSGFLLAIK